MGKEKIKDALDMLNNIGNKGELKEKIEELGQGNIKEEDFNKITDLSSKLNNDYDGKSEEELLNMIGKMKENVDTNKLKKTLVDNKQILKQLYSMMDVKNKKRMEKVLKILNGE